jgi:hypothetical protein
MTLASAGLFQSLVRIEEWGSVCLESSAAVVGAMQNEMIAVLGVVSLVTFDRWF